MNAGAFFARYVAWHYSAAFLDGTRVGLNFTWFFWRVFSVPELAQNLFVPFERLTEKPRLTGTFEQTAGAIIVNVLMRVLGALFRLPILLLGVILSGLALCVTVLFYPVWVVLPILIPFCVGEGLLIALGVL